MRKLTRRQLRKLILREANILSEYPQDWNPDEYDSDAAFMQLRKEVEKKLPLEVGGTADNVLEAIMDACVRNGILDSAGRKRVNNAYNKE